MTVEILKMLQVENLAISGRAGHPDLAYRQSFYFNRKVLYCRSALFMYSYRITVESKIMKSLSRKLFHRVIAIAGLAFISSGSSAFTQQAQSQVMNTTTSDTEQAPQLASGELDSLVAPIALYPDPLLAQTLAASTYPLEVIQLQQWMDRNKNLQEIGRAHV